ncbi:MAG: hypothetical protein UY81_C0070G0004 [Candidatus Giovannonibacteria bacterium GW2011_GWA2_53_7]|uniref:Uncharacterized protein n=1 Tax=Candidatus Giovannonibacteria bacterium GW2011_GWA2_53_7 TaxID=1618650 RepID=A0A0G1XUD1_9BACT|nr:MAG: hypothetical protein UY81_C0070G0004 [Candidatus Giovannonibacteria bacterium GW2011_GWA2_53_7]
MSRFIFLLALTMVFGSVTPVLADTTGPTVSVVSPLSATYTVPATFSVTATDPDGVASCTLLVSSVYETPMTYNTSSSRWETSYTFSTVRSANSIRAVCVDTLGNETKGPSKIISVAEAPIVVPDRQGTPQDTVPAEVDATAWSESQVIAESPVLIKTVCPGGEDFTHPCRTVYFLDKVGHRHAFPNERVYFTWYTTFENIHLITNTMMASFSIGPNVTSHPGTKMVKFPSVSQVYAVARYGVLRPIVSETVARELYGANWNQQIDDVSEAFYSNYVFGDDLTHAIGFDVEAQRNSVSSINDNYVWYDDNL